MRKKIIGIALIALTLSISTSAFAANSTNDQLSKLKDIGNDEQNSSSEVISPITSVPEAMGNLPTIAQIKADFGEKPDLILDQLKTTAETSVDASDHLKLAVAYELTDDNKSAINSLHKAISLAPTQKELYEELVKLYQTEDPGKISVFINGEKINFKDDSGEVNPVIINQRTLVPIRKIAEKLGAQVKWDAPTLTANVQLLDTTVQLVQDSKQALVNGKSVPPLDTPAQNLNGHLVLPLRFVGESFNKAVDFISATNNTAIITIEDK